MGESCVYFVGTQHWSALHLPCWNSTLECLASALFELNMGEYCIYYVGIQHEGGSAVLAQTRASFYP